MPTGPAGAGEEQIEAIASVLGGENSRFYWNVIQKGISPQAGVWGVTYADCGFQLLYAFGEPDKAEQMTDAMRHEAEILQKDGIKPEELQRFKNRRRTGLAVDGEAAYNRLMQMMQDIDYHDYARTLDERLAQVDAVTVESLHEHLARHPVAGGGYFVSVGPREVAEAVGGFRRDRSRYNASGADRLPYGGREQTFMQSTQTLTLSSSIKAAVATDRHHRPGQPGVSRQAPRCAGADGTTHWPRADAHRRAPGDPPGHARPARVVRAVDGAVQEGPVELPARAGREHPRLVQPHPRLLQQRRHRRGAAGGPAGLGDRPGAGGLHFGGVGIRRQGPGAGLDDPATLRHR